MATDLWRHRDEALREVDLVGFEVLASNGGLGTVQGATYDAAGSYLVVETADPLFGHAVLVPAGLLESADADNETVRLSCSREELVAAPRFDPEHGLDDATREELTAYWGENSEGVA